jgi:hypothetical protein
MPAAGAAASSPSGPSSPDSQPRRFSNVVNPDALIARTNLDRPPVDVAYLGDLSDDAVPMLLERLPTLRADLRKSLAFELLERGERRADWRSFNLARPRASKLLAQHREEPVH